MFANSLIIVLTDTISTPDIYFIPGDYHHLNRTVINKADLTKAEKELEQQAIHLLYDPFGQTKFPTTTLEEVLLYEKDFTIVWIWEILNG